MSDGHSSQTAHELVAADTHHSQDVRVADIVTKWVNSRRLSDFTFPFNRSATCSDSNLRTRR
jgi:hypothetical protein